MNHPKPQKTTKTRQRAAAQTNVLGAHKKLGVALEKFKYKQPGGDVYPNKRSRIIVVDETGGKNPSHTEKVATLPHIPARSAGGAAPPHVTLFGAVDLNGFCYPPLLICPKTIHMPPDVVLALETSKFKNEVTVATSEEGYINHTIFFDILEYYVQKYFVGKAKPTASNPIIFVADGHSSRIWCEGLRRIRDKHIFLFLGVPNGTHIYSPLDDQIFKQYNRFRRMLRNEWEQSNNNPNWHENAVEAFICAEAWYKTVKDTDKYALCALKNVGLQPWDENKLKVFSAVCFGVDVDQTAQYIPPKEPTTIRDHFTMGGWATDEDMILWMEEKPIK